MKIIYNILIFCISVLLFTSLFVITYGLLDFLVKNGHINYHGSEIVEYIIQLGTFFLVYAVAELFYDYKNKKIN